MVEKKSHFCEILKLICINEEISRRELANKLNISGAAVTNITRIMLDEGMILETGDQSEESTRSGRKRIALRINPNYKYVVGVNIELDRTFVALCDLLARPIHTFSMVTRKDLAPEDYLKQVCDSIHKTISAQGLTENDVIGIGVSIIGIADYRNGVSVDSFGIWKHPVYVCNIIEKYLDIPSTLMHNTNSFATAGILFGRERFSDNLLYIKWIPGVGGAVVIDGRAFVGTTLRGAEIGHTYGDYTNVRCRCGRVGCLETLVSIYGLTDMVKEKFSPELTPTLYALLDGDPSRISIETMPLWMDCEDAAIQDELRIRINKFVTAIANTAIVYNSEKIVFYGQGFFASKKILDSIRRGLLEKCEWLSNGDIMLTDFSDRYNYIGPVAVAIQTFFINKDLRNIKQLLRKGS